MKEETVKLIVILLGVASTLGIYSILYKENKVFRFFEHLYLGLAAGYSISAAWNDILRPQWWTLMMIEGRWWMLFAIPAAMMFYMIYSKQNSWMSHLIFGLFLGATAGQTFQAFAADYFPKFRTAASKAVMDLPEVNQPGAYGLTPFSAALNNVLFMVILASVMTYFFFSFEQKGKVIPSVSKFGRYTLMVAFGALFGSTIMARMSLLIGRMYFLIHDFVQVQLLHMQ